MFSNHEKLRLTCSKENKNCCTSDYFPVLPVWVKRYNFKFWVFKHLCVSPNFWVAIPGFWGGLLARVVARVGGKQGSGILRSGIFSLWLQCLLIGNHKENHSFTIQNCLFKVPMLNTWREGFWRALALMIGASASGQGELLTKTVSGSPGELAVSENPAGSSCNYAIVM